MRFKYLLLIGILMVGCKGGNRLDILELNSDIVKKLKGVGLIQISCEDSGSPPLKGGKGLFCFVSHLTREQAVDEISKVAKDYSDSTLWAEDYGQYHADYNLKQNPEFTFGFAVTRVKFRSGEYKDKSIEDKFESDIIFKPIAEY